MPAPGYFVLSFNCSAAL